MGQRVVFESGAYLPDMFREGGLKFGRKSPEFVAVLIGGDESLTKSPDVVFHATVGWHTKNTTDDVVAIGEIL